MVDSTLAVIGTAGRKDDAPRINRRLYDAMYESTLDYADAWKSSCMVSGGAAVADHLAVRAFVSGDIGSLTLFLPAEFTSGRYEENPRDRMDPGRTANNYHRKFSEKCGLDSFGELRKAIEMGARVEVHKGFKNRNLYVASEASHMLALTFGARKEPEVILPDHPGFRNAMRAGLKDGGTAHTWGEAWKCEAKAHVSLSWLEKVLAEKPEADIGEDYDPFGKLF